MSGALTRYNRGLGSNSALTLPNFWEDDGTFNLGARGQLAVDFVSKELKLDLIDKREKSLVNAMVNPSKWLDDREGPMNDMKENLAKHYATKLQKYYNAGFPADESAALAAKSTNRLLQEEMEELEMEYPGASTIYASAAHQMADRNTRFNLGVGGVAEGRVSEKEIYKKIRAAKKAKKAKRAAKSIKA